MFDDDDDIVQNDEKTHDKKEKALLIYIKVVAAVFLLFAVLPLGYTTLFLGELYNDLIFMFCWVSSLLIIGVLISFIVEINRKKGLKTILILSIVTVVLASVNIVALFMLGDIALGCIAYFAILKPFGVFVAVSALALLAGSVLLVVYLKTKNKNL